MNLEMFLKYGDKYNGYMIWKYDKKQKKYINWEWSANGGEVAGVFEKEPSYWKVVSYKTDYDEYLPYPLCIHVLVVKDDDCDEQLMQFYNHFPEEVFEGMVFKNRR